MLACMIEGSLANFRLPVPEINRHCTALRLRQQSISLWFPPNPITMSGEHVGPSRWAQVPEAGILRMGTKMKGLLKGLRYISQIFDTDTKEQEMQIGYPTDVKHVAHIGWDGPSVNSPSWMNEFRSAPLSTTVTGDGKQSPITPAWQNQDLTHSGGSISDSAARDLNERPLPRPSRRNQSSSMDSPPRRESTRTSRRNPSAGTMPPGDSPVRDGEGSRHSRRSKGGSSSAGQTSGTSSADSPVHDLPGIPKQSRRRKTKGGSSSGGGSSRSSRSKALASFSDVGNAEDRSAEFLPVLKPTREGEELIPSPRSPFPSRGN